MNPLDALDDVASVASAPWKLWLVGGAVLAAVTAGGLAIHGYGEKRYAAGQAETQGRWNAEKVLQQAAALRAQDDAATETQRRLTAQQESQRAHDQEIATAQRDAAAARTAADGLRRQLAAFTAAARGGAAAGHPAATVDGAPARDALDVLADLLSRADGAAGELAEAVDRAAAAGRQCERAYDALTVGSSR